MKKNLGIIFGILVIAAASFIAGYSMKNLQDIRKELLETTTENREITSSLPCTKIRIDQPQPNTVVKSPLTVSGEAIGNWFFEANAGVHMIDGNGKELGRSYVTAQGEWMTENCVPFTGTLEFRPSETETGEVVFTNDNPSGNPATQEEFRVPVKFEKIEISKVKVFFHNKKDDPNFLDCSKVFPIERNVPKTAALARAALDELLKGPTFSEAAEGYFTNLPQGANIQKLIIENGVAKVDFDKNLEEGVGGSCRVAAIRSQITQTLKQFPSVKEVIISINGRTEDILQP